MKKAVFGIIKTEPEAQKVVNQLESAGFSTSDISVIFSEKLKREGSGILNAEKSTAATTSEFGYEKHSKAPEGASTAATAGGVLGGSLGLLAGIGAISIPGLGAFIAAGPLMAALGGSAIGGSLGLFIGTLVGMGIPEYEAKLYQDSLNAGKYLISVHIENNDELNKAIEILRAEDVKDISSSMEKSSSD
ncbi:Uncharacterized protein PHSC3_001289 [Chlamydiales bacterium STE3]|nr:Uncharacterized protein PHSC3_001289 [Chlamydiales bacterium STE3]